MKEHYLKVGDLLKVIKENNLPDDVSVCYHRIEDFYFNPTIYVFGNGDGETAIKGWDTIKIKGDTYYKAIRHNNEIERGKLVIDGKLDPDEVGEYYWNEKYKNERKIIDINDETLLDQYIEGFCCFYNKEKNILCITAHY